MREPYAPPIDDFAPRDERAASLKRRANPQKSKPLPLWRRVFGAKGGYSALLLAGFAAVMAIGVSVNALFLQEGRHPAPMFQFGAPKSEPAPPTRVTQNHVPLPPARPASIAAAKTDGVEAAKAETKPVDAIAQLLNGGAPRKAEAIGKNKTVLLAQRALAKLGYFLHQDGVFGGTTREAIEKFERANGMPVKGDLTPRLLRLLSQRSGVAMR